MNSINNGQNMKTIMEEPKNSTISDKVEMIQKNMLEIISQVNEISYRLFGSGTPKITENCENVPTENSIENSLYDINNDSCDVTHMLSDILKTL